MEWAKTADSCGICGPNVTRWSKYELERLQIKIPAAKLSLTE